MGSSVIGPVMPSPGLSPAISRVAPSARGSPAWLGSMATSRVALKRTLRSDAAIGSFSARESPAIGWSVARATLASASITARAGSEQRGRFGPPSNEAVAPSTVIGASSSHRLRRHRRAVDGSTREGAGDEPYVALGDPEGVANVAGAITVHVTQRGIRYRGAETGTYVELGDQQGVANVHYPIPLHVPTGEGPRDDLVDGSIAPAAPVDDVELAPRVEAERAHVEGAAGKERRGVILRGRGIAGAEAPDEPAAEVRVEVAPAQSGHAAAAVDEAAGDRAAGRVRRLGPGAAVLRRAVAVVEDGQREPRHRARGKRVAEVGRVEAVPALHDVPAVVETARERGGGHEVDLLEEVLPDVGDVEVAGGAVEGVAPRVAQPLGEVLRRGGQRRDVEAQELPQVARVALPVAQRIPAAAAVAHADVEHAVGAEQVEPAVVVREGLVDGEHQLRAQRVGLIRGGARMGALDRRVAVGDRSARLARVVHVDEA